MLEFIKNLLPDELGEVFGFSLLGGASYFSINKLKLSLDSEKEKLLKNEKEFMKKIREKEELYNEQENKFNKIYEENCLSKEAINFLKNYY